jgi:guanidinopropionase
MNDAGGTIRPIDSAVVPRFAQVATFMRTPLIEDWSRIDIGLVGVPFDLGATNRAGARHGPAQIREMSRLIRQVNPSTLIAPFELARVGDIGDAPVNPLDLLGSVDSIAGFFAALHAAGVDPVSAGGDHTVTLPILRGIAGGRAVGLIHFDAHADTFDKLLGSTINHATPFRRAVEEGIVDPKRTIQIGLRGTRYAKDDIQYGYDAGMRIVTMDEFDEIGRKGVIEEIARVMGKGPVYVTYDVDGLDPVYAPGTSAPEPGGLTMRDSQVILRGITKLELDIIGGDVCEVSPPLDPTGHTALSAANLMFEILCLVADARARRQGRRQGRE